MSTNTIRMRLPIVEARAMQLPAEQALVSMSLLQAEATVRQPGPLGWHAEQHDEPNSWAATAMRTLSQAEIATNQLIFNQLASALIPVREFASFPEYLEDLAATPAEELRNRIGSLDDPAAQALYQDPPALKDLLVEHLHMLWDRLLANEWRKMTPRLQSITQTLQQRDIPPNNAPATIRAVLGRDLPIEITAQLASIHTIIIVPSVHIGVFVAQYSQPGRLLLFVSWSIITGWALRQSPLRPAEIHARMAPLADENALKILDLLAQHGEQSSQELIASLSTSQSSVSRHLKSLGSYLIERRAEGANKRYQINYSHLEWSIVMLRRFLEADQIRMNEPERVVGPQRTSTLPTEVIGDLKRFSDTQGRLTAFPTRRNDQLMVLNYLIKRFEYGRMYAEREVNEIIRGVLNPQFDDFVTLRRELYNNMLLGRERDGSRYWRISKESQ